MIVKGISAEEGGKEEDYCCSDLPYMQALANGGKGKSKHHPTSLLLLLSTNDSRLYFGSGSHSEISGSL